MRHRDWFSPSKLTADGDGAASRASLEALEPRLLLAADLAGDAIADALDTGLNGADGRVAYSYQIGDGDYTGLDVDFYKVYLDDWTDTIVVDIDTPTGVLDSYVRLFDQWGAQVAFSDDADGKDSYLEWSPRDGVQGGSGSPSATYVLNMDQNHLGYSEGWFTVTGRVSPDDNAGLASYKVSLEGWDAVHSYSPLGTMVDGGGSPTTIGFGLFRSPSNQAAMTGSQATVTPGVPMTYGIGQGATSLTIPAGYTEGEPNTNNPFGAPDVTLLVGEYTRSGIGAGPVTFATGADANRATVFQSEAGNLTWEADVGLASHGAGWYYVGVSGFANTAYDPNTPNSGAGGTTGAYELSLQVLNLTEPGNLAPTDIALNNFVVHERAPNGAELASAQGADPNADSLAYRMTDDAGGRFRLNGAEVVVVDGSLLDYDTATSHDVTIRVYDGEFAYSETFTIDLLRKMLHDFDGDGHDDLLWRHTSGANQVWFMDGAAAGGTANLQSVDPSWHVAAVGDLTGMGFADILWRHTSGANHIWFMAGSTIGAEADMPAVADNNWQVQGIGDFNGDGTGDILWRHSAGANHIWFMNGNFVLSTADAPSVTDMDWEVGGVGDFNGDHKSDILWRYGPTGRNHIWFMDGGTILSTADITSLPDASWDVGFVGDFDGDGDSDIFWRHENGINAVWLMDGTTVLSMPAAGAVSADWSLPGRPDDDTTTGAIQGDLDGDGYGDLVWRHEAGANHVWFMNGGTVLSGVDLPGVPDTNWNLEGIGDFDGDGKADLFWRRNSDWNHIWFMDGATILSTADAPARGAGDWDVGGVGDFDGDGKADILWRGGDGTNQIWFMNGASVSSTADTSPVADDDWQVGGAGDFNGDGKADILWRHAGGSNQIWTMNGATSTGTADLGTVGADWYVGSVADYNGDGKADLVWRHDSGGNQMWFMDGATATGTANLQSVPTQWCLVGYREPKTTRTSIEGDFDGDGKGDILWRHNAGANHVWLMDGGTILSGTDLPGVPDTNWSIGGVGDFDGDGKSDILWRHTTDRNHIWFMNGTTIASTADLPARGDTGWFIGGVGDFDGDGKSDILWRNAAGDNQIWFLNGATLLWAGTTLSESNTDWQVVGVGDFNNDAKSDILWRHATTGQNYVTYMDGVSVALGGDDVATVTDTAWTVAGVADYNGDGKADLLWRHSGTGHNVMWLMNGVSMSSSVDLARLDNMAWDVI